ncbi:AsmA family protein [Polynucleobacter necessarius]|uniref:AsmA family protein n=1 Tax=Polynucleobacter necessarius TaxID=576610 RepID=UPI000E097317|nr:AsmA family protein [Polynucleobacter necessarius]
MSKALKISLIAFVAFLATVGFGTRYAASFINPTQLTRLLSASVKEATGRDLKITSPVSLHLFPSISVSAEQISLSNAPWARNPNMLTIGKIDLDIRVLPLF